MLEKKIYKTDVTELIWELYEKDFFTDEDITKIYNLKCLNTNNIISKLSEVEGKVGFYYKNLVTKEVISYNEDEPMLAASLIKLMVLGEVFRQLSSGILKDDEIFVTRECDKVPSCGALNYMDEGLKLTLKDLYTLMIILSDNYATNILIDRCKINNINKRWQRKY